MTITVADLKVAISTQGVQEAATQVKAVGAEATQTARALDIMAAAMAKSKEYGGSVAQALEVLQRSGAQPTTAALAQAAKEAESLGVGAQHAAVGFGQTAAAAREATQSVASFASVSKALSDAGVSVSNTQVSGVLAAQQHAVQQSAVSKSLQDVGVSAGVAAQQAKALTAETAGAVAPARAAAVAAAEHAKGWQLSESSIVRAGAGVLGISVGFSLIAGAARLAHAAIADLVGGQLDLERSVRTTAALYGAQAVSIGGLARAQTLAPDQAGTTEQHLQSLNDVAFLRSRYGFSTTQLGDLTSTSNRLSLLMGDDRQALMARQATFRGYVEGGGPGLRSIGLAGDPLESARSIGLRNEAAFTQGLTPAQQDAVRAAQAEQAGNAAVLAGTSAAGQDLQTRLSGAQKARDEAASALQDHIARGGQVLTGARLKALIESEAPHNVIEAEHQQEQLKSIASGDYNKVIGDLQGKLQESEAELQKWTAELGNARTGYDKATADLAKLGLEANTAAIRMIQFAGSLEDRYSIARGDVGAAAQAAVAARAVGPNPLIAKSAAELQTAARQTAESQTYQGYVAEQAQQDLRTKGSAYRDFLQHQANVGEQRAAQESLANTEGPGLEDYRAQQRAILTDGSIERRAASAQRALDELPRRELGANLVQQANQAGAWASRAQTEAQAQISAIGLTQEQRRLDVAEQQASLRRDALTIEGQMAPLLLQQATLQDRITVAARDNLATRRELIGAEQQQLAATQVTSAYDYQEQRAVASAQQRQARQMLGMDVSDLPTYEEDIRQSLTAQLMRRATGANVAALDASRNVQVFGQQLTGEQLARDTTLTSLEAQRRAIEDQAIPLTEAARLEQARQDVISRTLEILNLGDTAALVAAQTQLTAADGLRLLAAAAARGAVDYAAGLNLGATAAERAQAALEKSSIALRDMYTNAASKTQVDARLAIGIGGWSTAPPTALLPAQPAVGPAAGTGSVTVPLTITISGGSSSTADTVSIVKREVAEFERRLSEGLRQSGRGGTPASSQLAGARR